MSQIVSYPEGATYEFDTDEEAARWMLSQAPCRCLDAPDSVYEARARILRRQAIACAVKTRDLVRLREALEDSARAAYPRDPTIRYFGFWMIALSMVGVLCLIGWEVRR